MPCDTSSAMSVDGAGLETRRMHVYPHWSDKAFEVPEVQKEGDIFYVTQGESIRMGSQAHVELLPAGHVAKTSIVNPYRPSEERRNRRDMEREAQMYCVLGENPRIPELISWDPESCVLTLEHCRGEDLESHIRIRE